ncbi:O-antigen ligase family protein [Lysobacter korlensis]|uniref:O-antigen ligase family protein n=1 Tax=Lysobacter korlensis TaxID=553636 RepID=A0ABV6RQ75_9GAMM
MLYLLLALSIILLPNALHVSFDAGVPGLNFSNLLFIVLLVVLMFSNGNSGQVPRQKSQLTGPLIAFFVMLVIGFLIAGPSELSDSMTDITRVKNAIFYPLLYFVFRHCKQDLDRTRQLILLTLFIASVAAVEAVYQGVQFGLGEYVEEQRATGPFGDTNMANRAGVFFAMFLPMLAALAVFDKRKIVRVVAVIGCVALAAAILFTYSRQSYLIALLGLLILLMHRSMAAAVLASVLLVATVSYLPTSVLERVEQTRRVDATGEITVDNSTASRLELWEGGYKMWQDNPAGVGLGRFPTYIGKYSEYEGRDAHNAFVLVFAELGLLGLMAMLWLFWRMWKISRMVRSVSPPADAEGYSLALGFRITVFAVALSNVYGSAFFEGLIMASFWMLCGLMERYAVLKAARSAVRAPAPTGPLWPMTRIADRFPLTARTMPGLGVARSMPRLGGPRSAQG